MKTIIFTCILTLSTYYTFSQRCVGGGYGNLNVSNSIIKGLNGIDLKFVQHPDGNWTAEYSIQFYLPKTISYNITGQRKSSSSSLPATHTILAQGETSLSTRFSLAYTRNFFPTSDELLRLHLKIIPEALKISFTETFDKSEFNYSSYEYDNPSRDFKTLSLGISAGAGVSYVLDPLTFYTEVNRSIFRLGDDLNNTTIITAGVMYYFIPQ